VLQQRVHTQLPRTTVRRNSTLGFGYLAMMILTWSRHRLLARNAKRPTIPLHPVKLTSPSWCSSIVNR
jgi:hypothetical protein